MKKSLLPAIVFAFSSLWCQGQFITGVETVFDKALYVFHSQIQTNDTLSNTSNIYIIKGLNDTVWIFGCGYGDKSVGSDISDLHYYKALTNVNKDAIRDGLADAVDVNTVIQSDFGFTPESTYLVFITPHYHIDHLNKEFIAAFFENLGYDTLKGAIFVHTADYFAATCNLKCCGSPVCDKDHYFQAPFNDPWTPTYLGFFKALGTNSMDKCNKVLKTFTSVVGNWTIHHNYNTLRGGHTDGTLYLRNKTKKLFLPGADQDAQCPVPTGFTVQPIHGNLVPFGPKYEAHQEIPSQDMQVVLFPNPCTGQITISFNEEPDHVSLRVVNILGKTIVAVHEMVANPISINTEDFARGLYCYQLLKDSKVIDAGTFVKE